MRSTVSRALNHRSRCHHYYSSSSCLLFILLCFCSNITEASPWLLLAYQQQRRVSWSMGTRAAFSNSRMLVGKATPIVKRQNVVIDHHGTAAFLQPQERSCVTEFNDETASATTTTTRREWMMQGFGSAAVSATIVAATATMTGSRAATAATMDAPAAVIPTITKNVCDPSVSVWQRDSRLIYLLGTAHISSTSAQTAGDLVKDVQPKAVFVELDLKRVAGGNAVLAKRVMSQQQADGTDDESTDSSIQWVIPQPSVNPRSNILASADQDDDDNVDQTATTTTATKKSNPFDLRQKMVQAGAAAVGNSIKTMYQKLDQSGFRAGEEFVNAIRQGQEIGAAIVLGDRDVEVTLRRLTMALSQTDLGQLFSPDNELEQTMRELLPPEAKERVENNSNNNNNNGDADWTDAEFKEELSTYVETLRTKENVRRIMQQLQRVAPALYQVMLAERDAYMAAGLDTLGQFQTIVAVMGIAHVDGVEHNLQDMGWKNVKLNCKMYLK